MVVVEIGFGSGVRTYIRTYLLTYVCPYIRTYIRTYVRFVRTDRTCMHMYVCTYVRMYVRTYVHMYVRTYVRGGYVRTGAVGVGVELGWGWIGVTYIRT